MLTIVLGTKNKIGRDQIVYIKRLDDGSFLYIEEVRSGKKVLAAQSVRKYPATINASALAKTADPYVRNVGGTSIKIIDNPARSKGNRYSIAARTREVKAALSGKTAFERATNAASDLLTQAMVGGGARPGQFSSLALAPVRALFTELAEGMPSAIYQTPGTTARYEIVLEREAKERQGTRTDLTSVSFDTEVEFSKSRQPHLRLSGNQYNTPPRAIRNRT